ncbi:MAG TPA: hypothetical protein VFA02_05555 [Pseudacidobacterium sp.]|nr:hypothetical protein [Pseudacidobacterium sp.]
MTQKSNANYGIQADSVKAGAIAVGPHAHAVATPAATPGAEQENAIRKLKETVQQLSLASTQQKELLDHLDTLSKGPPPQRASTIDKIVSICTQAGHLAAVVAPLKAVAAAFGLVLPF